MNKISRNKLSEKQKKELFLALGLIGLNLLTLLEFKIQDFSPWIQILRTITIPIILIIGIIIFIFFRKRIFVYKTKPTNSDYLRETISILAISSILTIPVLGFTSLTNRTIGNQDDYILKGEIISLDSTLVYNKSTNLTSTEYSVELIENQSKKKYEFNISTKRYKDLKGQTEIERKIKKGFWGYLYEN
nr:hypothetical protein [uncultured Draconibacterium sp.]